jgi:hypothetical protein
MWAPTPATLRRGRLKIGYLIVDVRFGRIQRSYVADYLLRVRLTERALHLSDCASGRSWGRRTICYKIVRQGRPYKEQQAVRYFRIRSAVCSCMPTGGAGEDASRRLFRTPSGDMARTRFVGPPAEGAGSWRPYPHLFRSVPVAGVASPGAVVVAASAPGSGCGSRRRRPSPICGPARRDRDAHSMQDSLFPEANASVLSS